jgi:Fe-S-cluster containining protein
MSDSIDLARIKDVQRKSRQSDYGEWHKNYTRQYRQLLEDTYDEIRTEVLRYTDSIGENITCGKGCNYCCEHFVSVPVSHAVVITDYLYASENAMSAFLRGYARWQKAIEDSPRAEAIFSQLQEDTTVSAAVKTSSQELLSAYHTLNISCPFLDGRRCAIYPVRPLCCAAYFSVSPPECCRSDSETPAALLEITPSQPKLRKLAELTDPRLSLHQEPLPSLVYKLLTRGLPEVAAEVERLFAAESQNRPETSPQV